MSYLNIADVERPRLTIPKEFDAATAKAIVAKLAKWEGRPIEFADEDTLRIVLSLCSAAAAERIKPWLYNTWAELAFYRHIPPSIFGNYAQYGGVAAVMETIRGFAERKSEYRLQCGHAAHFTDAEVAQVAQLFADVKMFSLRGDAVAARRLLAAVPPDALNRFWAACDQSDRWLILREMSEQQFAVVRACGQAERKTGQGLDRYRDRSVMFEMCRRGTLTSDDLEQTCTWILATVDVSHPPVLFLDVPRAATEPGQAPSARDVFAALVQTSKNLSAYAQPLRKWFDAAVAQMHPSHSDFFSTNALFMWSVIVDEALIEWFAARCVGASDRFAKAYLAADFSKTLAISLVGRSDGDVVIDKLRTLCKKQKRVVTALDNASAQWSAYRAELPAGAVDVATTIDWGRTPAAAAVRILSSSADPMAMLNDAIASPDPVAVLNAMQMPMLYAREHRDAKHLPWTWAFVEAGLRALERSYTVDAPDRKALDARIGGTSAKNIYLDAMYYLQRNWTEVRPYDEFVNQVMVPLYLATSNERVKWWLAGQIELYAPALIESDRSKIMRLAAELANERTEARTLIFVGNQAPGPLDVNRLFGPAIGVTAARWPKYQSKKMQHVITLETKYLEASVAHAYADRNVAAVALFVSDLANHQAFAPNNEHVAIVELSSVQLAKGCKAVHKGNQIDDGRLLEPVQLQLPSALFVGGKKAGAMFELRKALDDVSALQPARGPHWIQSPEPSGTFLFDFDERFAGDVNVGDDGRFYVFADTAFIQSM